MARAGLIEAYLEQLTRKLPRTAAVEEVIAEVEDHLNTIVEAHLSLGLSEEAATGHAVGAFGSADLVARAFAEQKGDTAAMPTTFTTYAGAAAMVGGVVLGVVLTLVSVPTVDTGPSNAWLSPMVLTGAILAMVGLLGIHARHRALYASTGRVARLLVPVGVVGVVATAATWFGLLVFLAATALGLVGLGVEVWRGGVIPRAAVVLADLGLAGIPPIVIVGSAAEPRSTAALFAMAVSWLVGGGLMWLGHGLWRERADLGISSGGSPTATACDSHPTGEVMSAALRNWWPLPALFAAGLTADVTFKSSYGELGEHAAGHLASASVFLPSLTLIAVILWATPAARRQVDVWLAASAWTAALFVVMVGNLRVVNTIGELPWTDEGAAALGAGIPGFESGHDLAAVGAWTAVAAAIALAVVLLARGHVSPRAAVGSVALSLIIPPFLNPGAGVLVLVVALCLARRRREVTLLPTVGSATPRPSYR